MDCVDGEICIEERGAPAADCHFREADYSELREALRTRRREQPFSVRADSPRCQQALQDVLRNAPLLRVEEAAACTLVLRSAPDGWGLDLEGDCLEGEEERFFEGRGVWVKARPALPETFGRTPVRGPYDPPSWCPSCCVLYSPPLRWDFSAEIRESADAVR